MELYVVDGDYGLPSLDVECTKSILFTRAAKVPVTVKLRNGIRSCCSYSAPTLVDNKSTFTNFKDIAKHLRTLHYNIDCGLSSKQASDLCAVESLLESKLYPTLLFIQWVDPRNCDELISPWYMKALPFPFNSYYVKQKKNYAEEYISSLYPNESIETVRDFERKSASTCLATLSTRLGSSHYFYGEKLTTLDVLVYSYVAPLVKLPFLSTDITNLISLWPNLITFVKRVDTRFFSDLSTGPKYLKKPEKIQQNDDEVSYVTLFFLITSASTIMFCFAVSKGIIKFSD